MATTLTLSRLTGTVGQIEAALTAAATTVQEAIADAFEDSKTLRGPVHVPSADYTDSKAAQGFDTRPGHRSNRLQESLRFDRLFTVSASPMRGSVTFDIALSGVEYATHYSDLFTPDGDILALTQEVEEAFRSDVLSLLPAEPEQPAPAPRAPTPKAPAPRVVQPVKPAPEVRVPKPRRVPTLAQQITSSTGALPTALAIEIARRFRRVRVDRRVA